MNATGLNPYTPFSATKFERGLSRFRLRRWFALALYLALFSDYVTVWHYGFHPFLTSVVLFMLALIASVPLRPIATVKVEGSEIHYQDFVQCVDLSFDRIERVIHRTSRTEIKTSSPLATIMISRKHSQHQSLVRRLAELQSEFGFQIMDT